MFERSYTKALLNRLEDEPRRFIQVLFGPRQVGKTTIVRQCIAQTTLPFHIASADGVMAAQSEWIQQQWEIARLKARQPEHASSILIIDEIQKIDNWAEFVKKEWDADTLEGLSIKVVLLGSSRLMLQKGLTESLAGRFETTYVGHWSFAEMNQAFGLSPEEFAWFGAYPGAAALISQEDRWKEYIKDALIETSISKDILMLSSIDKPALLKRLFEIGCSYSGQIVAYNKVMGQLTDAGNTTTLAHYLRLLDSAGLLGGLEKFSPDIIRQRGSSPKFQVHNTALLAALSSSHFEQIRQQPAKWGRVAESAIGAHLLNSSIGAPYRLYYWRDRNDEVDFVLQWGEDCIGIEVASGSDHKTKGMAAFQKRFRPKRVYLTGKEGIPWQEMLNIDPRDLF
jgi:uncharacterized protein